MAEEMANPCPKPQAFIKLKCESLTTSDQLLKRGLESRTYHKEGQLAHMHVTWVIRSSYYQTIGKHDALITGT